MPPQHAIDAAPILVLYEDPAWDLDTINSELAGLESDERRKHPYVAYQSGIGRYDLHAQYKWKGGEGCAADYFVPNSKPIRIELRRLRLRQISEVQDALSRETFANGTASSYKAVWYEAARYGIESINGDSDLEFLHQSGCTPEYILERIYENHGHLDAIAKIGAAIWNISQPLTDDEKKR